jgi:hypothetical protein
MPFSLLYRGAFAISAVAVSFFACLLTLLKSVLRSDCTAPPGGSKLRLVGTACTVAAALSLVASAVFLIKSRAWSWTRAAAICSKWQPVYFLFVSVQRLIATAIVTYAVSTGIGRVGPCSEYANAVHVISLMWICAILMTALSTMSCDIEAELTPALRRCAYGLLALVLLMDVIGSVVWGNSLASDISFFVTENFNILLDNQITSCIASQVVIALHFLYVSCRSRRGRGWAYASLRFELDELGRSMSMPMLPAATNCREESRLTSSAAAPMLPNDVGGPAELQHSGAVRSNMFFKIRRSWLKLQQRQVLRCRVFVIPCVVMRDAGEGGGSGFTLARPAVDLRWLRPLQRLADKHPRFYVGVEFFFLAAPSIACYIILKGQGQARGISNLVFNSILCIMKLGFVSSKRYGFDRVALKHIALSFRFAIFVTLLTTKVALEIRQAFESDLHPTEVVANVAGRLLFCMCIPLECSPNLPPSVQIFISVKRSQHCASLCLFSDVPCRLHGAYTTDITSFSNFNVCPLAVTQISIA